MQVSVSLFGALRRYSDSATPGEWKREIPEGSTVRDLARAIGIPDGELGGATIDGRLTRLDGQVPSGTRVLLFAWTGGG